MPAQVRRMPLWLAVGITVVVALPFGLLLKGFNLVLWIAFTVWGVYLAMGGTPQAAKRLLPAYAGGAASGALVHMFALALSSWITTPRWTFDNGALIVPVTLAYFVGFCVVVWWMRFSELVQTSSLAYFTGIALTLGAVFTGMGDTGYVGHSPNQYVYVIGALIVSVLSSVLGCAIAALSVWLNGVRQPAPEAAAAPVGTAEAQPA
ncbi:MAG: hypothetical protein KQH57_13155 [Actinomycetales bacterium]|nr:hypothetical protein [Actinomycetales bacterium]